VLVLPLFLGTISLSLVSELQAMATAAQRLFDMRTRHYTQWMADAVITPSHQTVTTPSRSPPGIPAGMGTARYHDVPMATH
jgi:hypothetical protein